MSGFTVGLGAVSQVMVYLLINEHNDDVHDEKHGTTIAVLKLRQTDETK